MSRIYVRIAIVLGLMLAVAGVWRLERARVSASATPQNHLVVHAQLSEAVSVHAARRGFPHVNLTDGHELLAPLVGESEAAARLAAQGDRLAPLAVTAADIDGDGVADLICSYDSPQGAFIAIYRGNVDALYPNSPQAQQRRASGGFTNAPLLGPARIFAAPVAGELMVAGDFNGDAHTDIVITSRASRSLYLLAGDGTGDLRVAKEVALPGTVTAMASGDVNRRDGLADILVGITGSGGPRALVFEGGSGALNAVPQTFALPAAATDFAIGQFDDDPATDIAIAAGRSLLLITGRNRKLVVDAPHADGKPAKPARRDLSFNVRSLTFGKFGSGRLTDLGLLADDGALYVLRVKSQPSARKAKKRAPQWSVEKLAATGQATASRLLAAHVSSRPADTLLLLDKSGHQLRIIEAGATRNSATVDLDVEGEAIAALPMRLNADGLDDLVILRRGESAPTILTSAPATTFSVTNTGDNGGVDPAPGAGTGTLRQAIVDANATAGTDLIQFSIGTGLQTINLVAALPTITEGVTIDGTSQPGFSGTPLIELNGASTPFGTSGVTIQTNNVSVRGLVINLFIGFGVLIDGGNSNTVQACFLGTDAAGAMAMANSDGGVGIFNGSNNTVGDTTASGRNLLSGNIGVGVSMTNNSGNNVVEGNFIGTDVSGTVAIGNGESGVSIDNSIGDTIGGTTAGARNLISGNNSDGIFVGPGANATNILGNFIGTTVTGTSALANSSDGVVCSVGATGANIGGTSAGQGNTIAFNQFNGVLVISGSAEFNTILGNSIFSNGSLGINLSDDQVTPNDNCDADTGPNDLQNFPLITSVTPGAMPNIQGTLNSLAGSMFRIEFFKNSTCDPSGNGEGQTFLGSTNVTTNAACNATFNVSLSVAIAAGDVITATASDEAGNTSEFSPCFTAPAAGSANLSVEVDGMPNPVAAGADITYSLSVTNGGPDDSTNVTVAESVPANTTFKALSAPPGWTCTTPAVGGTGPITCNIASLAAGANAIFQVVVTVNPGTPGGTVISFTTNLDSSTPDPDLSNNSGTVSIPVTGAACTITCPANVSANSSASQCGATVDYSPPTVGGNCGTVACTPPSGSFFQRGVTNVTCTTGAGPSCSFTVTVIDNTPPVITCPFPITVATDAGKSSAVVNYPIATATDACGVADVVCLPPSGTTFPLGTATVNCTARDVANNTSSCSFTITVNDADAPVIRCPNSITMELPASQTSAVINYPPPTATDNLPGVVVTCTPPSGTTFPLGTSTVICVAVDVNGNSAACGFSISLTGGPPNLQVIIPTGKSVLEFGTTTPVEVKRKNKSSARGPCAAFTVVNRSFSRLDLTLDNIRRIGSDVDSGHISDSSEGDTYSLSVVNANGLETPLDVGDSISLPVGGRVNFCLRFSPVLPPVAGSNMQLRAPQAIPDLINSRVTFRVAGGTTLSVNVNAIVETALHLINPNNPKKAATLGFTRSDDQFSVTFAVHDANDDVRSARYEFLDAGGRTVAGPFDIDLTQAIRDRNLVRGQSFTVTQLFSGANSHRNISAVRVTVSDGETSITSPVVFLGTSTSSAVQAASQLRLASVMPPAVQLDSPRR